VHAHHGDEHHLILSGRWRMSQGDHVVELGPGDYLAWDPSVPHDVENIGDDDGRILIVYPRRGRRAATEAPPA
jgi:mannose-6-phosphate isomerase-like protein (cupin superfamily)